MYLGKMLKIAYNTTWGWNSPLPLLLKSMTLLADILHAPNDSIELMRFPYTIEATK